MLKLRRAAARLSTHARTPAQEHQFALYETLAARNASDEMLQTANSALTCLPRGPRRELPMPNRRKTDADELAFRRLIDDVATAGECARARAAIRAALQHEDGPERLLSPYAFEEALGPLDAAFVQALAFRLETAVRREVATSTGATLRPAGLLVNYLSGVGDGSELRPSSGPFAPHCDRANRDSYDVSALLYLSTAGEHFSGGGEFAFNDDDRDRLVEPREGRVLCFSSGFENLHQVRPMADGERFTVSAWYTRTTY